MEVLQDSQSEYIIIRFSLEMRRGAHKQVQMQTTVKMHFALSPLPSSLPLSPSPPPPSHPDHLRRGPTRRGATTRGRFHHHQHSWPLHPWWWWCQHCCFPFGQPHHQRDHDGGQQRVHGEPVGHDGSNSGDRGDKHDPRWAPQGEEEEGDTGLQRRAFVEVSEFVLSLSWWV